MTKIHWWENVARGDIAWCWFPNLPSTEKPPKPRPALVLQVDPPQNEFSGYRVTVAYGTSKLTMRYPWDVIVTPYVWEGTGLAAPTRFDFTQRAAMPFTSDWFTLPDWNVRATSPILGRAPIGDSAFTRQLNLAMKESKAQIDKANAAISRPASGMAS